MILVLASRSDGAARALVERWSSHGARLLLPDDLSVVGWRHGAGPVSGARAVAGGAAIPVEAVEGVLTRLPGISPADLIFIQPPERDYVAAEMTAFLLAWLRSLPGPVLNRPTPACLMGPSLRPEQWIHAAAESGVPVAAVRRTGAGYAPSPHPPGSLTRVTVVGDRCLGASSARMAERAIAVARRAEADLLAVSFAGPPEDPVFTGADLWLDLFEPRITGAVLALLRRGGPKADEVHP